MILDIIKHPNEILRETSLEVNDINSDEINLIKNMVKTMNYHNGIGLAAPQVGVLKRIIVVKDYYSNMVYKMINPKIITKSKRTTPSPEGCLSIEGIEVMVPRYEEILLEYRNELGIHNKAIFKSHISRVIQHEIDHLNGKLIIDY